MSGEFLRAVDSYTLKANTYELEAENSLNFKSRPTFEKGFTSNGTLSQRNTVNNPTDFNEQVQFSNTTTFNNTATHNAPIIAGGGLTLPGATPLTVSSSRPAVTVQFNATGAVTASNYLTMTIREQINGLNQFTLTVSSTAMTSAAAIDLTGPIPVGYRPSGFANLYLNGSDGTQLVRYTLILFANGNAQLKKALGNFAIGDQIMTFGELVLGYIGSS